MKRRKLITRVACVISAILLIITSSLSIISKTYAKDASAAAKQIEEAAHAQLYANTLAHCLIQGISSETTGIHRIPTQSLIDQDLFGNDIRFSTTLSLLTVPVGPALEDSMGSGVLENPLINFTPEDGEIYCGEGNGGITNLFASSIGISFDDVICNKEGGSGVLTRYDGDWIGNPLGGGVVYDNGTPTEKGCRDYASADKSKTLYRRSKNFGAYLKSLWQEYHNKNHYAPENYLDVNTATTYRIYSDDFKNACAGEEIDKETFDSSNKNDVLKVTEVNNYGGKTEKYYKYSDSDHSKEYVFFPEGEKMTCSALADRISGLADVYAKAMQEEMIKACSEADPEADKKIDEAIARVQKIIDSDTASDDQKNKAKDQLERLQKAKNGGERYMEGTNEKGEPGIICVWEDPDIISNSSDDAGRTADENACYDNAGVPGWVICPAISMFSGAGSQLYKWAEENYLKVPAREIFVENNSASQNPTYTAWSAFRDLANIVFVVLFLIVIISQLTGYGIDNYGIKRMLPRLIIAAILINLSYFICQLAVDVANIIGVAIRDLLTPDNFGIFESSGSTSSGAVVGTSTAFAVGLGAAAGAGIYFLISFGPFFELGLGIIVAILLAVVAVAIAILFLWIILVARQAIIVLLIVLSPVAFACFVLPNTESLSKRWLKAIEGVLILYPLCSLVMSGGKLAGSILANMAESDASSSFGLAAMIAQVLPFFAIPLLLKGSMASLGNLGAKITGIGQGLSRGIKNATNKAMESDSMKAWKTNKAASITMKRGDQIAKGAKKKGIKGAFYRAQRRQGTYVLNQAAKLNSEGHTFDKARNALAAQGREGYDEMMSDKVKRDFINEDAEIWESNYKDKDGIIMRNDLKKAMKTNDEKSGQIEGIVNSYMNKKDFNGLQEALAFTKGTAKTDDEKKAMDKALERAGKAIQNNRNFGDLAKKKTSLGEWAKDPSRNFSTAMQDNIAGFKQKDWSTMDNSEQDAALAALDNLKGIAADTSGRYSPAEKAEAKKNYTAAVNTMRAAANNESLHGNMTQDTIDKYRAYAGPAPTPQQPIAQQTSGAGQTLNISQGPIPHVNTPPASAHTWTDRAASNAAKTKEGLLMTGGDPRNKLNLPGKQK